MHTTTLKIPLYALLLVLSAGCSHMAVYRESEEHYMAGDFKGAAQVFTEEKGGEIVPPKPDSDGVLPNLYMGAADFMEGDFQSSISDFERFEEGLDVQEHMSFVKQLFAGYMGKGYDAAMANTYKALAYMAQGEPDEARVEFNRAEDVAKKIAEKNKAAIDEKNGAAAIFNGSEGEGGKRKFFNTDQLVGILTGAISNDANQEKLDEYRHSIDELCGAGDFENPAVFFLDGILDLFWGEDADDYESAAFNLKQAFGLSQSPVALVGSELGDALASGRISRADLSDLVCVFFENGLCATKESNLYAFLFPFPYKGNITLVTVALDLPKLVVRDVAYPSLVLREDATVLGGTLPISDFNRLVATEYRAEMPRVILWQTAKCLLVAAVEVAAINVAREKGGPLAELAVTALMAALATKNIFPADLRHWNYLPREFQGFFLRKPASGKLMLYTPGMPDLLGEVDIPQKGPALVYVKIPFAGARPLIIVAGPGK